MTVHRATGNPVKGSMAGPAGAGLGDDGGGRGLPRGGVGDGATGTTATLAAEGGEAGLVDATDAGAALALGAAGSTTTVLGAVGTSGRASEMEAELGDAPEATDGGEDSAGARVVWTR
jgi:hypothetical protein